MRRPNFTDGHRWPLNGRYISAARTNVAATLERARKAQEALARAAGHHPITQPNQAVVGRISKED